MREFRKLCQNAENLFLVDEQREGPNITKRWPSFSPPVKLAGGPMMAEH